MPDIFRKQTQLKADPPPDWQRCNNTTTADITLRNPSTCWTAPDASGYIDIKFLKNAADCDRFYCVRGQQYSGRVEIYRSTSDIDIIFQW